MKKILLLLALPLLLSCQSIGNCQPVNSVSIATFNIRIFSDGSRNDEELRQICEILKRYDFIAIQELRDTDVLDRTVAMLEEEFGLGYLYVDSPPVGRRVKELYAFLYRSDVVTYLEEETVFPDPQDDFIREPFYALFSAASFDFYVITIHSIYGDTVAERRYEAQLLDEVYQAVQGPNGENDVLLMGDFNLDPQDEGFEGLRGIPGMIYVNEEIPTSIKDKLYDNIWFQGNFTQEYTAEFGVFKFDEELYGNDDSAASLAVSDHRPLWAVFDIQSDDD